MPLKVKLRPEWLVWGGGKVRRVAEGIDAERAFDLSPVLADALEEAGCPDVELLEHLRGPGPQTRVAGPLA